MTHTSNNQGTPLQYIVFNGKFCEASEVMLSFTNRSFNYGDGVFETIRYTDGKLLYWEEHLERLAQTALFIKLDIDSIDWDSMKESVLFLLDDPEITNARIKIQLFRKGGGLYRPLSNQASYLITAAALSNDAFEMNINGLKIAIYDEVPQTISRMSAHKTSNALIYILASIFAQEKELDDALLINQHGKICEATASNAFFVFNNSLFTPPLIEGCLNGIMRTKIIKLAEKNGIKVTEQPIPVSQVPLADEIFFTNSITGISWVGAYGSKRYFNRMALQLLDLLNQDVKNYTN